MRRDCRYLTKTPTTGDEGKKELGTNQMTVLPFASPVINFGATGTRETSIRIL